MANDGELVFGRDHFSLNGVEVPSQVNKPVVVALPNMRNTKDVELVQYAPNCLEHRKCIKMDLKCPTIVLNCLHILDYIFMVDLKSKNLHMGTHKGQNS